MIKPIKDRILILPDIENKKTKSGFIVQKDKEEAPRKGEVVAVGEDQEQVKIGDYVMFKPYHQTKIKEDGTEYILMEKNDVLAILNKKDA